MLLNVSSQLFMWLKKFGGKKLCQLLLQSPNFFCQIFVEKEFALLLYHQSFFLLHGTPMIIIVLSRDQGLYLFFWPDQCRLGQTAQLKYWPTDQTGITVIIYVGSKAQYAYNLCIACQWFILQRWSLRLILLLVSKYPGHKDISSPTNSVPL